MRRRWEHDRRGERKQGPKEVTVGEKSSINELVKVSGREGWRGEKNAEGK